MSKLLKLFVLSLTLAISFPLRGEDLQTSTLRIGVYNNPPKISVSGDGIATGYHIDILNEIFRDSPYKLEYIPGSWDEGLSRLKAGEIDIMPDVAWSPERAAIYDFNNEYILLNWACVYSSKTISIDIIPDLAGKRVAVMKNSIHTEGKSGIINQVQEYGINCDFIFVKSYDDALSLVDKGTADAAVVNRLFGLLNEDKYRVKRSGITFNPSQLKYAFRKNAPGNKLLVNLLDSKIKELKADRESVYYRAFNKYLLPEITKEKKFPEWSLNVIMMAIILSIILGIYIITARSGKIESDLLKKFFREHASMQDIRLSITDNTITALAIFSIPLFLSILYHGISIGWNNIIWLYLASMVLPVLAAIFKNHITITNKMVITVGCMFFTGILILKSWGGVGTGFTFFLTASIIITLIYGKRLGLALMTSGLMITIIFGILIKYRVILYNYDLIQYSLSATSWIFSIMAVFMLFFTIISGVERFYENLVTSVDNLEQKVRERTSDLDDANISLHKEIEIRKKVEEELIIAKLQAEQASKAKGIFLASMTHEIRTPLNAILGYSQIMMREKNLPQESLRQIEIINTSGEHLLGLINEILDMSKIEAGKTEVFNETFSLYTVMKQIKNLFSIKTGRKGIGFDINIRPDVPDIIITDKSKLKQILINLIGNAIKFTDKGTITVELSVENDDPEKLITTVSDTGKGIPPEFLEHIFDPFEQAEEGRNRGGTGLGLPISRNFVNMLGGDITIKSTLSEGSCFTFTIRFRKGEDGVITETEAEKKVVGIKSGIIPRVIIVDDRDVNRDILIKILEPLGYIVKEASGGSEALDLIDTWEPDLVLLDLVMPEVSGRDVIRALKKNPRHSGIKIIVITASALEMEKDEILELGADSFIRKPFRESSILNEIKDMFGLEYNYEEAQIEDSTIPVFKSSVELSDRTSVIPEDVKKQLSNALVTGDIEEINSLISKIAALDEDLAKQIKYMADDFEFSSLIEILKTDAK